MASYTDILPQFTPYTPQLPVEAMMKVGMAKQAQYQEGVQKIQGQIDKIAGLDILRDVDKQYLQSKLDELGNNLTSVAAGDFSNFQLVNSVAGMTGQITKDPFVRAAVTSTANDNKNKAFMEEQKKKGTLTPENEYKYLKQRSAYINAGLSDSNNKPIVFSEEYQPYFDVFKFAKETFDALKPDGFTFDQVYQLGADGKPLTTKTVGKNGKVTESLVYSPAMIRMDKEGIFPEKVKATLSQIFADPRVGQQLQITGEYDYRAHDSKDLIEALTDQRQTLLSSYNDKLLSLNLQKNLGKDVQSEIDDVQSSIAKTNETYDAYNKLAISNPDSIRGLLYKNDVNNRYTTMFGYVKSKEQALKNPYWETQFEMQKEANEQSRFAQRLKFDMTKEQNDNYWKQKEYDQRDRLALLAASAKLKGKKGTYGEGSGPGGDTPEQANQPSDIDKLHIAEKNYENSVTDFINSSDRFLWEALSLGNENNLKLKKKYMDSGKTEDEAIHLILNDMAKQSGESPEAFRARWGDDAVKAYQNLSDSEKEKNPAMKDSYLKYKSARRTYDNESTVKKLIDEETIRQTGAIASKLELLTDIPKEINVQYNNKPLQLTKDDLFDMAVYLRGYKSSLGFLNDDGAREAGKAAYARLKLRGKADIADDVLNTEGATGGGAKGPITRIVRGIKYAWSHKGLPGLTTNDATVANVLLNVKKVFDKIDNEEYENGLKVKAGIVDRAYGIKPNLKQALYTGDNETDKNTTYQLQRMAGEYGTEDGQRLNLSHDFEQFREKLDSDPSKNVLSAQTILDAEGNPKIEIVSYDVKTKKRIGGMTLQPDEAAKFNLDVNTLYEPREISSLRTKINYNGGQTSIQNVKETSTYIQGDSYFDTNDFPNLQNTPYQAQANIKYSNGMYYPYVYITDGKRKMKPRELPGQTDLQSAVLLIKEINPTLAEKLLIEK